MYSTVYRGTAYTVHSAEIEQSRYSSTLSTSWKCLCRIRVPTLLNFFVECFVLDFYSVALRLRLLSSLLLGEPVSVSLCHVVVSSYLVARAYIY